MSKTEIAGAGTNGGRAADPVGYKMFIDNAWVDAVSGATRSSVDPFRGETWALMPDAGAEDVDRAVAAARRAFDEGPWPRLAGRERGRILRRLGDLVGREADRLAAIETRDNGKLLREMGGQLRMIPNWFEYFAGWADKLEGGVLPTEKNDYLVYTRREPVGVVAAITAWNSPLLLAAYKCAPALAAGCTVVLKPAEQTSVSSLELAKLFEEADFPEGVFNVITGDGPHTGAALTAHPGVNKIAFTGSSATGSEILRNSAANITRTTLELGGKSPNIVCADANLEAATNGVVAGVFAATGQTCVAGSRVLVHEDVFDDFVGRFAAAAKRIRLGDPLDAATEMGPVAFPEQLGKVTGFIDGAVQQGAEVIAGGGSPDEGELAGGLFVEPTVLGGVQPDWPIAQEEIFGPVAAVIPFKTEDEVVAIANDVRFGLAAGVWTTNLARAHRMAAAIRSGTVWINSYRMVSPGVPCGGLKLSGLGRENGREAIMDYTETKAVWVNLDDGPGRDPFMVG
jgi:aldehyde dehydrogenase (NAD+)